MERTDTVAVHLTLGTAVTAIFFDGMRPQAAFCTVTSEAPLYLETTDSMVPDLTFPRPVLLLWHGEDAFVRGDAEAVALHDVDGIPTLELGKITWYDLDRRRHPRVAVQLPVALRAIHDVHGATTISVFPGITEDLSEGGAWIRLDHLVEVGSLVEFQARLDGTAMVRAFGVVVRSDAERKGIGVTFLDYLGGSKTDLAGFLRRSA